MIGDDNDEAMLRSILGQSYDDITEESRMVGMLVLKWARRNAGRGDEAKDRRRPDVADAVMDVLSERYDCDARAVLRDSSRRQRNVELRYIAYKVYREFTGSSLSETSKALGSNASHCTLIHGIQKIEDLISYYADFRASYNAIVKSVIQRVGTH